MCLINYLLSDKFPKILPYFPTLNLIIIHDIGVSIHSLFTKFEC